MKKEEVSTQRMIYEVMGADIADVAKKAIPVPSKDMIGGFAIASKMFSIIADIQDTKDPDGPKAMERKSSEAGELANEIIKACGKIFDGKTLNAVNAGLSEAIVKMAIARDKKEMKGIGDIIGEFISKLGGHVVDLSGDDEPEHECHADCPMVGLCPKGRRLFSNDSKAKAENVAKPTEPVAKKEAATTSSKEADDFATLKRAIELGDSVTAMNLMSKLMTK